MEFTTIQTIGAIVGAIGVFTLLHVFYTLRMNARINEIEEECNCEIHLLKKQIERLNNKLRVNPPDATRHIIPVSVTEWSQIKF